MPDLNIKMPHEWEPRPHQLPFLRAVDGDCRRAVLLWHRRAGKDAATLNWIANRQVQEPLSALYMLPEFKQAKRVLMRELNEDGRTHIDQAYPKAILKGDMNKTEGVVTLFNGSVLQLGGFDRVDSYLGMGPKIVVMSEFAVSRHAERALQLLMPILLKNKGWLILPYTPRGRNHGFRQYEAAKGMPDWFVEKLTIEDTGLVPATAVQEAVESGTMTEYYARQDFWCSWEAPNTGSYYGRAIERLEELGQVTEVAWEPSAPVFTFWDIGVDDATAIWFAQPHRSGWINLIDYYEADGEGLAHYLGKLNDRKAAGWTFDPRGQLVPHDFAAREFTSGESRTQAAKQLGWRMTVVPQHRVEDGTDAVRRSLPKCRFDRMRCERGLDRLKLYCKRWSDQLEMFTGPLHDVNSHAADAFRTGIMGLRQAGFSFATSARVAEVQAAEERMFGAGKAVVADTSFNVWGDRREERGDVGFSVWGGHED